MLNKMNDSTQRYLNRFLEGLRKVYGQTEFMDAYNIASKYHSYYLGIREMVGNKKFSQICESEIDKAYRYAKQCSFKNRKVEAVR
jgi:hypothetical protein